MQARLSLNYVAPRQFSRTGVGLIALLTLAASTGCYVPLRSPAIPACHLPAEYRSPSRSVASPRNLSELSISRPGDYLLGPGDTIEITVTGLSEQTPLQTIRATIMGDGTVRLPLVNSIRIDDMNLAQAQTRINEAYEQLIQSPRVTVLLAEKAIFDVVVTGAVTNPGVYPVTRYQSDLAHALALAGGTTPLAADRIELHRRATIDELERLGVPAADITDYDQDVKIVLQIPLRGGPPAVMVNSEFFSHIELTQDEVHIRPGDVVVIPTQPDEVFFVVGPLNQNNVLNFRVSEQDRRLGNAFLLPRDRDVDVVTGVAMAGYIDPINSPSTVTVHRSLPGEPPLLIRVDLIAARYNWHENVYIQPGDIIYLNPDAKWWMRRTFDRILPDLLTIPYREAMELWINPNGFNNN